MTRTRSNIILIGMPGAGKSTVGPLLAQSISRDFLDTDLVIQASQKRALQDIVNTDGQAALRLIEEEVLLGLACQHHVIATGGSAVYSEQGMMHLKTDGIAVFLDTDLATLASRIDDFNTRGLVKQAEQTFAQLFDERLPLYRKYADITINCAGLSPKEVCARIIAELESNKAMNEDSPPC
ncbi:MAG: shikimate kinase [Candidatus Electrothrix sp. AR5]|nr:shikimate kinase [Candidatus Electrothrix sp. AR5]